MSEFHKILVAAVFGYASSLASVLVGYWLTISRENRTARRGHKTELRLIRASFPVSNPHESVKRICNWWLHAVDDCGSTIRWRIEKCIAELKSLKQPIGIGDPTLEAEQTPDRVAIYNKQLETMNGNAAKIMDRIIKIL